MPHSPPVSYAARRREAVSLARIRWHAAPLHVRALASPYVDPLLAALEAVGVELDGLDARAPRFVATPDQPL